MGEIKITYETLFDILRRERSREELQKLEDTFFEDVAEYLREKNAILEKSSDQSELFKASEAEKTRIQIHNIKKILKELYEARERKIINRAVNKVKTGSEIIDTSALLGEEQRLFQELANLLSGYRRDILVGLINGAASSSPKASQTLNRIPDTKEIKNETKTEKLPFAAQSAGEEQESACQLTVRFLHSLPKFVGRNQEIFGPFAEDEVGTLPAEIASILVKKGRAEEIKEA
jgi:DNA replication initiation complex subunit (GINS family)